MRLKNIFLVALLFLAGCTDPYTKELISVREPTLPLHIKNVAVFNGKDSTLIQDQDVLIQNGKIVAMKSGLDNGSLEAKVIDGSGHTLMPGLIDAHVHLSGSGAVPWQNVQANMEYNLSAYLYTGITTVYDLGGIASQIEKLANRVDDGELAGPDVYHTHIPITVKDAHPIPLTEEMLPWPLKSFVNTLSPLLGDIANVPKEIENYVDRDLDFVKIICDQIPPGSPEISYEQLSAAIAAAHALGYKTFVHVGSPENAVMAVKAGADVLAHGVWRGALLPQQADLIATSGVPIIYTLSGFMNVNKIYDGAFSPSALDTTLVPSAVISPVSGKKGLRVKDQEVMNLFFKDVSSKSSYLRKNFEMLAERGVPVIVGTDSSLPGTYAGSTYIQEIEALKSFGLSNYQILKGATYLPSRLFLESPDFGYVAEGMKANLLLLEGNPLVDLSVLKEPVLIIKEGLIIDRLVSM